MNVVIVGAGGHGRVVLDVLSQAGEHTVVGFIDADVGKRGTEVAGVPVLGAVNILAKLKRKDVRGVIVGIGDNRVRLSYAQVVMQAGMELINAVHPGALVSPSARLGRDILVAPGAIVGTDARVEDSAIINTGAILDHECMLEEGVHVAPGAILAGRVRVGQGAFIGLGARILPCLNIGLYATIGAGAVVLEDVPARATVVGVPARVLKVV